MRGGPRALWLVRHGESEGNLARQKAYRDRAHTVESPVRDADSPLSPLGEEQARGVGRWLGALPGPERPTLVLASPHTRTLRTAQLAVEASGLAVEIERDERLRERETGIIDELTWHGVLDKHPGEAVRARRVGRLQYRPPGGESWADVALRLRSLYADVARDLAAERVLVVTHDVVVQLTRYVVEGLDEATLAEISDADYANAALTSYERGDGGLGLTAYNRVVI